MCVGRFFTYIWKGNKATWSENIFFSFNKNKLSILTFLRNRNRKHGLELTDVTVGSLPGGGTGAVEGSVSVHTSSAVLTRKVQTLVHVYKYSKHILKIEQKQNALPIMSMQYYFNFLFSFYFSIFFLNCWISVCTYFALAPVPASFANTWIFS